MSRRKRTKKGRPYAIRGRTIGRTEGGVITRYDPSIRIPSFYFSDTWTGLRREVLERDHYSCQYCHHRGIQADHVIPRACGGADDVSNLVACCPTCNKIAKGRVFESFRAKRAFILAERKRRGL